MPTPEIVDTAVPAPAATMTLTAVPPTVTPSPTSELATPVPTMMPSPTPDRFANWQPIFDAIPGWQLAIPPDWINLTRQLATTQATTPFGLTTLLITDSERTGANLLAEKPVTGGAFVIGLLVESAAPVTVPVSGLRQLLAAVDTAVTPLNDMATVRQVAIATTLSGAAVDVLGHPLPFIVPATIPLRTQLLYLSLPLETAAPSNQLLLLFSAPLNQWEMYNRTFTAIAASLAPAADTAGTNNTAIRGSLTDDMVITGNLQQQKQDVWTLSVTTPQYLNLLLQPENAELDLSATIIGPQGSEIAYLNNGFISHSERAVDLFLPETGLYFVIVSEFHNRPGAYGLEIDLAETTTFTGRGELDIGESVLNTLRAGDRHLWTFAGTAEQTISLVLNPAHNMLDFILNVYGPDGTRLVALDEGFSGDPEIASGVQLPLTGSYTVVVSSFSNADGAYALAVNQGSAQTTNFYDAGDLIYGQSRRETLRPQEAHAWFFRGHAGDEIMLTATPLQDDLDLDIWLVDPDVERVAAADEGLQSEPEMIAYKLETTGQYLILVREFSGSAGGYEVSLKAMPSLAPSFQGTLLYSTPITGTVVPGETAVWQFAGSQNDVLTLNLQPTNGSDLILFLQTPDGETVLTVDDGAVGAAEEIIGFRLTSDGQWRIQVQEFYGELGEYQLSVRPTE